MKVYLCEPSMEGLLTAVFYSYFNREVVRISAELGCVGTSDEVVEVAAEWAKAERVMMGIFKCDGSAPALISLAYCLGDDLKYELIHRFLRLLFAEKRSLRDEFMHVPEVREVYHAAATVEREIGKVRGAIRFRDTASQVMYAQFVSEFDIMGVVLPRLAYRFKTERMILHDVARGKVGVYVGNSAHGRLGTGEYKYVDTYKAFLGKGADYYYQKKVDELPEPYQGDSFYQAVWDEFFAAVSVPGAQNVFDAVRYRWYAR